MTKALNIIQREHRNLGEVLYCLESVVRDIDEDGKQPDFRLFHAIINYLDSFLERFHHPKEDEHLFPAVMRRYPDARAIIDELEEQHVKGAELSQKLRQALADYEVEGKAAFPAFRDAVHEYAQFEKNHAWKEERELMPLAQNYLTEEDWKPIDEAFSSHEDPLFGDNRRKEYEHLFSRIVNLAPAPHGLGHAWGDGQ